MTATSPPSRGLEGIIAGKSAIGAVLQDRLIYRGYEIHDLAENASFDEVAYLMLEGQRPSPDELRRFKAEIVALRPLPHEVETYIKACGPMIAAGSAEPMDILRTCVSILGNLNNESQDNSAEADLRKSKDLFAKIPTIIGHMQNVIDGRPLVDPQTGGDPALGHAANLLYLMTGSHASDEAVHVMDVSLILYAEHDFNASTFTARTIAATLSDLHGAVTGAIAALKGKLHGGANEAAMEMLREIQEHVDRGGTVEDWMADAFATKKKLMGFGHRVYKHGDHRAGILHDLGRVVAEKQGAESTKVFELGEKVQKIMNDEKGIFPNVDFPCGMTYFILGIPVPQYTPIFVASRITGWCAHVMEQHADNRLIRPLAEYIGPDVRPWK